MLFDDCSSISDVLNRVEKMNNISQKGCHYLLVDLNKTSYVRSLIKEGITPTEEMIVHYHLWYFSKLGMSFKEFLEAFSIEKEMIA